MSVEASKEAEKGVGTETGGGIKYRPEELEPKWQQYWVKHKTFRAPNPGERDFDPKKPKFYVLDMFPYPSGSGLHVGHPEGYTATDIIARWKRMCGCNVLHPMGWDAFGLPAEQYAVETGTHPRETTRKNIANIKRQIQALGFSYDWDRELDTTDPKYYRWTQWIFLKLYEKGLAYIAEVPVWWCEKLGTVLANEEVVDGRSERGNYPCERRPLRQWMLRITAYAERLLADLDELDWPESIKIQQRNWIGRSEGAEVEFELCSKPGENLRVFTTRPDTLYGATYMVLAPEHPLVAELTVPERRAEVEAYVKQAATKTELARAALEKEKSGVFTGAYAWNPVYEDRNEPRAKIPIWIADYVLTSYGTGAIMAVPAHDERDAQFAVKYDLPIRPVVLPPEDWLKEHAGPDADGKDAAAPRERYARKPTSFDAFFVGDGVNFNSPVINGLPTPEAKKKITAWLEERGRGRFKVSYRLRDWLFSRQRYWGEPFPLLFTEDGKVKPVPEEALPVTLPEMTDYRPGGTAEPPLAKVKEWVETADPETGKPARRETNTMPQWAGSCWYYLRFLDARNDREAWSPEAEKYWMSVDLYVGGAEHAVLHLLYARFWHKVLYDLGLVSTKEPFHKLYNQGLITAFAYKDNTGRLVPVDEVEERDGGSFRRDDGSPCERITAKMSKSLKNVVNPDEVISEFGADTLRLYEMFLGPLSASKPWNPRDVPGVFRFLQRVWRCVVTDDERSPEAGRVRPNLRSDVGPAAGSEALERELHRTIKKVTADLERLAFNTAISALMTFVNKVLEKPEALNRSQAERFLLLLAPFAPHLAEELWARLGHGQTLAYEPWPTPEEKWLRDEEKELAVQINGKVRAKITVAADAPREEIERAAQEAAAVHLAGKIIVKTVVVPARLVNIVAR